MRKIVIGCLSAIGVFTIVIIGVYIFTTVLDSNGTSDTTATQTLAGTTTPTTTTPPTVTTATVATEQPAIEIDLLSAQITGFIDVSACGSDSLESIKLSITSNSNQNLEVAVLPGTIFEPQADGMVSSMMVIKEAVVELEPNEANKTVNLDAACINMQLDVPSESDMLELSTTSASGDLGKLIDLPDFQDFDFRIQQFAIWTITDNPGRDDYMVSYFGLGSQPSDEEIEVIKGIFETAGIDTEKYRALRAAVYVELMQAKNMGLVDINASGTGSINRIQMSLTSKTDDNLEVAILPGTIFTSSAAGVQSMVVTIQELVLLDAYETTELFDVDAACANMELDAPEESNSLALSTAPPPEDLIKLLSIPDFQEGTFRVRQFAIWTITDNPERDGYIGIVTGFGIFGSGPSDEEIEEIRVLFIKAGITISKYKALA